jgi:hypothetical protein
MHAFARQLTMMRSLVGRRAAAAWLAMTVAVSLAAPASMVGAAADGAARPDPAFQRVWARTAGVVAARQAERPWIWGPESFYTGRERFGDGARLVQYYPKGRMEITRPEAPADSPGYVTNGRLVVELVSGELEVGEDARQFGAPAQVAVAGDPAASPNAPTYASFRFVASLKDDRRIQPRLGQPVQQTIARDGFIGENPNLGAAAVIAAYSEETGHNIPGVFVDYLAGSGPVSDGFRVVEATLLDAPLTVGYPITEAYWTQVVVDGRASDVMIQLFERRTLLYWPDRPAGFGVEMGDVGQHYFQWRYHAGLTPGQPARHNGLSLVVTSVSRATVEPGPAPAATPPPPPADQPEARSAKRKGAATPAATPTPAPVLPPGALTTDGVFVIAELSVTNVGRTSVSLGNFILIDDEGRQFELSAEATALAARRLGRQPATTLIRPGFTVPLVLVWEAPATARGLLMVPAYGEKPALAVQ